MITDINQLDLTRQYTLADYLTWEFKERVELVRGWIMRMAAPNDTHQRISMNLSYLFAGKFRQSPCAIFAAPFDVCLPIPKSEQKNTGGDAITTVVEPDLCVICDAEKIKHGKCFGAPDLVVEILSPGNRPKEMQRKKEVYEEAGVREYWLIDPSYETVRVYHLDAPSAQLVLVKEYIEDETIRSIIASDFTVAVNDIFYRYSK